MEDADEIMARSALGEDTETKREELHERISNTMQQAFELRWQWEINHTNACKEVPSTVAPLNGQGSSPFTTVLHFYEMDRAIEITFFNTIHLLLGTILDSMNSVETSFLSPLGLQTSFGPFPNPLLLPGQGSREDHALEICRIVDFMSHCKHDSLGIFMLLFPLYVARTCLTQRPDVCTWIGHTMKQLVREKGFDIGEHLSEDTGN